MAGARHKTTVYLDAEAMALIERAARDQRRSTAALIREALALYAGKLRPPKKLSSEGCVRGKRSDIASRDEAILRDVFRRR